MRILSFGSLSDGKSDRREIRTYVNELASSLYKMASIDPPEMATAGATYGDNERAMLQNVHDKLGELIAALKEM